MHKRLSIKADLWNPIESKAALLLVFLLLIAIATYVEYPGWLNKDSELQYRQAVSGHYTDWHPPIMSLLWSLSDRLLPGRAGMFLFQIGLYWLGLIAIAWKLADGGRYLAAWAIVAIAALPPNLFTMLVIQKDAGLAGSMIAAFGLTFLAGGLTGPLRWAAVGLAVVLLAYATLVRVNGVFATPAALLLIFRPSLASRPVGVVLVCCAIAAALVPVSTYLNNKVMQAEKSNAIRSLQLFDLAGVAVRSGDFSMFPQPRVAAATLPKCYTPVLWDPLGRPPCNAFPEGPITKLWLRAITQYPLAYAGHRAGHFMAAVTARVLRHHGADMKYDNRYYLNVKPTSLRAFLFDEFLGLSLFTPLFSLATAIVALALSYRAAIDGRSDARFAFFLASSGILYGLPYLLIGVASDTRYFLWSALAGNVALVVAIASRFDRWRRPGRAGAIGLLFLLFVACATQTALFYRDWKTPKDILIDRGTGLLITAAAHITKRSSHV